MRTDIEDFKPISKNHVLNKLWNDEYGIEFKNLVSDYLGGNESLKLKKRLSEKLHINHDCVLIQEINQYIQSAVEVSVVRYFKRNFPDFLVIEPRLNSDSNTDVECQFQLEHLTFNIEVKASSYISDKEEQDDNFKIQIKGHLKDYKEIADSLKTFIPNSSLEKRFENNLKSHLLSSQTKYPKCNNKDNCNVLIIGCNDSDDIQNHYDYLFVGGFFTKDSFVKHSEFDLVDIVFLTNQFFKHNCKNGLKKLDKDSWLFEKSFIVGFRNPFRRDIKTRHLNLIESIIPNYNNIFKEYRGGPDFIKLKHFIHSELGMNRKIYHY
jgi:hypothetical protein